MCSTERANSTMYLNCIFPCPDGYLLDDSENTTVEIHYNGKEEWRHQIPRCKVIQCERPEVPDNAVMNCSHHGDHLPENSICNFSCKEGFAMVGSSSLLCTTPGQWSGSPPTCEAIQCDRPPAPKNGAIACSTDGEMLPYNAACNITCDKGFILEGNPSIQCVTPGRWSAESPQCKVIQCECPEVPYNGVMNCSHHGDHLPENSMCNFSCKKEFTMVGSSSLLCTTPGQWSGSPPTCEAIQCDRPPAPKNGAIACSTDGEMLPYNAACNITCDKGFILEGNPSIQCVTPGRWSAESPQCKVIQCERPDVPYNGVMNCSHHGDHLPENSMCNFSCKKEFTMVGSSSLLCTTPGQWSGSPPTCEAIQCDRPPAPKNGAIACSGDGEMLPYNAACNITCDKGFILEGNPSIQCVTPGRWSAEIPHCKVIQCECPDVPYNGVMNCSHHGDHLPENSMCNFSCKKEFTMVGSSSLLCTTPGQWSGSPPTCEAIQCDRPPAPKNGAIACSGDGEMLPYNAACNITCDKGFILEGNSSIQCVTPGRWSAESPQCKAVRCDALVAPAMGDTNCSDKNRGYGTVCTFSCTYPWTLNGTDTLKCETLGEIIIYMTVGIFGSVVVFALIICLVICLVKWWRKKADRTTPPNSTKRFGGARYSQLY
ncbi:P-selectin-like isoform X2 [Dendropsophus ebraccatus]